jgi:hypothetical protein
MTYAEFLRVRKVLTIYAIVIGASVAVSLIGLFISVHGSMAVSDAHGAVIRVNPHSNVEFHGNAREAMQQMFASHNTTIPLSVLLYIAFFGATIIASIFGAGLCRERDYVAQAWTKPVSRIGFALRYLGMDVAGIVCALAVFLVVGVGVSFAVLGILGFIRVDAMTIPLVLLAGGIAFAYYGVVRAVSVGFPGRGGVIAGTSWGAFFLLIVLVSMPLPALYHTAVIWMNFINPLAYLTNFNDASLMSSVIPFDPTMRTVLVWCLAVVSNVAAIAIYNRAEA